MNSERPAGSIYDLGYRPYEGKRLGHSQRILALYVFSLRAIFGLGRSAMSKVFPIGLALLALTPAAVQLAVAAIAPVEVDVVRPENFFSFVQIVVALFCAVAAPEITGRDQRNHTLPLYFSRAISRADYVAAKAGALFTALLIVLIVPQVTLFLGNAVSTEDLVGYLSDNAGLIPPILASSVVIGLFMTGVSLAIASQTPRRPLATGAVIAYFVIASAIGSVLIQTTTGDARGYMALISPFNVLYGAVHWLFDATPEADTDLARANLAGGYYFLAAVVYTIASLGVVFRRYQRMTV
jgi:ABC-2 type transport system permease protein